MRLRSVIRSLFALSATETRGFWAFIVLLLAGWFAFWLYQESRPAIAFMQPGDARKLDSLYQLILASDSVEAMAKSKPISGKPAETEMAKPEIRNFPFDPNHADYQELMELGFDKRLASQLLAYRKAGGSFRYKADLQKLYNMTDSLYTRLRPFITLPDKPAFQAEKETDLESAKAVVKEPLRLDVNAADSLEFLKLYGIGPVFAGRLVKFRDALGGFVSVQQVKEMYGLPEETFIGIQNNLYVADTFKPEFIRLNTASMEELAKHPYLSYAQAKVLIAYRQQHGPFQQKEDLLKIHTFNEALLHKLAPYLTID